MILKILKNNMSFFIKNKILVTHNGTFHADDLFATATLSILNKGNIKIIRTRDPKIIESADFVYDVGGVYNPEVNRFDHHQKGGAENRSNGIPYAAFGLVWKKYGEQLSGSKEVAELLDKKIAQPIDASDNGVDIYKSIFDGVVPYTADQVFLNYKPTWKEDNKDIDSIFLKQAKRVEKLLLREIEVAKVDIEGKNIILENYNKSENKKIIIINENFPRYLYQNTLSLLPEPMYLIFPSGHSSVWKIEAIKKSNGTMESRKSFPESWGGVFDLDKLREISGISDIIFCHKGGFLAETLSKEGAISLAQKALIA
jgi:uncharacterized UPF0160 family protein